MFLKLQTIWSFSSYLLLFIPRLFCSVLIKNILYDWHLLKLAFSPGNVYCVNIPLLLKRMCFPQLLRQCWYMCNRCLCSLTQVLCILTDFSIFVWLIFLNQELLTLNNIGVRMLAFYTDEKSMCNFTVGFPHPHLWIQPTMGCV